MCPAAESLTYMPTRPCGPSTPGFPVKPCENRYTNYILKRDKITKYSTFLSMLKHWRAWQPRVCGLTLSPEGPGGPGGPGFPGGPFQIKKKKVIKTICFSVLPGCMFITSSTPQMRWNEKEMLDKKIFFKNLGVWFSWLHAVLTQLSSFVKENLFIGDLSICFTQNRWNNHTQLCVSSYMLQRICAFQSRTSPCLAASFSFRSICLPNDKMTEW